MYVYALKWSFFLHFTALGLTKFINHMLENLVNIIVVKIVVKLFRITIQIFLMFHCKAWILPFQNKSKEKRIYEIIFNCLDYLNFIIHLLFWWWWRRRKNPILNREELDCEV